MKVSDLREALASLDDSATVVLSSDPEGTTTPSCGTCGTAPGTTTTNARGWRRSRPRIGLTAMTMMMWSTDRRVLCWYRHDD